CRRSIRTLCRVHDYAEWEFDKLPERHSVKVAPRFIDSTTRHSFSVKLREGKKAKINLLNEEKHGTNEK
ncbi:MAG: hypothetical protein L0220_34630, partial [Acidobacteria bacterium]|nr:hypothetical protein [Acidobacteriota bacterium]